MTFDKDSAYNKSKKRPVEEPEEIEAPEIHDTTMNEEYQEEDQEIEEPQEPVDPPKRRILTRGNLLGYENLSQVQKDMVLQKNHTEKGKEPGPVPVM